MNDRSRLLLVWTVLVADTCARAQDSAGAALANNLLASFTAFNMQFKS